jgi:membrane-associated phospholipid phosphatase
VALRDAAGILGEIITKVTETRTRGYAKEGFRIVPFAVGKGAPTVRFACRFGGSRTALFPLPLLLLLPLLFDGCRDPKPLPDEPGGGDWKPILSETATLIAPAPPPNGGPEEQGEIDSLLDLQNRRTPEDDSLAAWWNAGASLRWNEIALALVAKHRTDPARASRVYALLAVAQYDASVAARRNKELYHRLAPGLVTTLIHPQAQISGNPCYPCEHSAIAAASARILGSLYPDDSAFLQTKAAEHELCRIRSGANFPRDVSAGDSLGRRVAAVAESRARGDGHDSAASGAVAARAHGWACTPPETPLLPRWGRLQPWLMDSDSAFRCPPPPSAGSPEFAGALAEVRGLSDARTTEQARIAALWADGVGSYTPSGRWNKIAQDLILRHHLNELRAARVFALLNLALMDAGVACWESKYHYLVPRPSQADPAITTPVGLPNFPSYPSAHSAFSGAAAEVLAYLFPEEKAELDGKAEEASLSRLYGGIHYRFDMESGLAQGRAIGRLAVARGRSDGSP